MDPRQAGFCEELRPKPYPSSAPSAATIRTSIPQLRQAPLAPIHPVALTALPLQSNETFAQVATHGGPLPHHVLPQNPGHKNPSPVPPPTENTDQNPCQRFPLQPQWTENRRNGNRGNHASESRSFFACTVALLGGQSASLRRNLDRLASQSMADCSLFVITPPRGNCTEE
jgi:hypothetical protein